MFSGVFAVCLRSVFVGAPVGVGGNPNPPPTPFYAGTLYLSPVRLHAVVGRKGCCMECHIPATVVVAKVEGAIGKLSAGGDHVRTRQASFFTPTPGRNESPTPVVDVGLNSACSTGAMGQSCSADRWRCASLHVPVLPSGAAPGSHALRGCRTRLADKKRQMRVLSRRTCQEKVARGG